MNARSLNFTMTLLATLLISAGVAEEVEILRVPDGGIQPQAVTDAQGTLHLVYYQGNRSRGNLFYVTRKPGDLKWSSPIQVNSQTGSANRNEPISRAQMAVGENGTVHVVWFNMSPAKFWYTRKEISDSGFEQQRNLVSTYNKGVETSASVAVDGNGSVFVIWHAGDMAHEDKRAVYMTRSRDGGQTFTQEERVSPDDTGACACCGLKAMVDDRGSLYVSYRAAGDNIHRDMMLLKSTDGAQSFLSETVDEWMLQACPVSTTAIAGGPNGLAIAWETKGQVYFAHAGNLTAITSAPGVSNIRRKNPALVINKAGNVLLAWGEGNGYRSGGLLAWQIFDAEGKATEVRGQSEKDMPDYSTPEVVTTDDGRFVIIF